MILQRRWRASSAFIGLVCLAAMMAAGCGYSLHGKAELPFSEIRIERIENLTTEPKLQDKLHKALVREFAKNGIAVTPAAGAVLSGTVRKFEMTSLAEKKDISVEYRIIVEADFIFKDQKGAVHEIKKTGSPFIVSSSGPRDMAVLMGSRDLAEEKAASDIAMEIVGALIYK